MRTTENNAAEGIDSCSTGLHVLVSVEQAHTQTRATGRFQHKPGDQVALGMPVAQRIPHAHALCMSPTGRRLQKAPQQPPGGCSLHPGRARNAELGRASRVLVLRCSREITFALQVRFWSGNDQNRRHPRQSILTVSSICACTCNPPSVAHRVARSNT